MVYHGPHNSQPSRIQPRQSGSKNHIQYKSSVEIQISSFSFPTYQLCNLNNATYSFCASVVCFCFFFFKMKVKLPSPNSVWYSVCVCVRVRVYVQCVLSCLLFVTPWIVAHHSPCPWNFPGKNTGVGCHFLLQGIFPTQGPASPASPALAGRFFTTVPRGQPMSGIEQHSIKSLFSLACQ